MLYKHLWYYTYICVEVKYFLPQSLGHITLFWYLCVLCITLYVFFGKVHEETLTCVLYEEPGNFLSPRKYPLLIPYTEIYVTHAPGCSEKRNLIKTQRVTSLFSTRKNKMHIILLSFLIKGTLIVL